MSAPRTRWKACGSAFPSLDGVIGNVAMLGDFKTVARPCIVAHTKKRVQIGVCALLTVVGLGMSVDLLERV